MPVPSPRHARRVADLGRLLAFVTIATITVAALAACADNGTLTESYTPVATRIDITDPGLIHDGDLVGLTAQVRDQQNHVMTNVPVQFTTTDASIATVTAGNMLIALREGTTELVATAGTAQQRRTLRVAGVGTMYRVATVHGRPLPANVHEELITRDDGSRFTYVERLESGTMAVGDRYRITLTIAYIERTTLQGNTIERVIRRRNTVDEGILMTNWLDASAWLQSQKVGGLTHDLRQDPDGPQLFFRTPGADTIWGLGLRLQQ